GASPTRLIGDLHPVMEYASSNGHTAILPLRRHPASLPAEPEAGSAIAGGAYGRLSRGVCREDERAADGLSVCMLGRLRVCRNGEPLCGLETRKTQELLAYLLLYRGRPHARDALADVLRGEHSTEQSRKYLRQTLWHLQVALNGPEGSESQRLLQVEGDWVGINPEAPLWLDLATLEHAFACVAGVP